MTAIIVVAIVAGVYVVYGQMGGGSASSVSLTATPAAGGGAASTDLVASLERLKTVTLNPSIFSDPTFQSLKEFNEMIPPQPLGRANPFAPLTPSSALTSSISLPSVIKSLGKGK